MNEEAAQETQAQDKGALMDYAEPQEESAEPAQEETKPESNGLDFDQPEWKWSDDLAGKGEKPDWLKERYKSVAEQAKAYTELEKKFGEFKGAPKDGYDLESLGELGKDPVVAHFAQTFKEMNLSQEGFAKIVEDFVNIDQKLTQTDLEGELKKLGPDANKQITDIDKYLSGTYKEDISKVAKNWLRTAEDVKAFQAIMAMHPRESVPNHAEVQSNMSGFETLKEVLNEKTQNWKRYKEDENYRESVKRRAVAAERREKALQK